MDDSGAGIYRQFAREEARDRGRLAVGWVVAGVVHLLLLLVPLPWGGEESVVALPPLRGEPFELRTLAFAPPQPPAPTPLPVTPLPVQAPPDPVVAEPPDRLVAEPPARARAMILLPSGPAAGPVARLMPPEPLHTPAPRLPEEPWRAGLGAEVLLTLVIDAKGQVAEVAVEEVRPMVVAGGGAEDSAEPGLSQAQRALFGRLAADAARGWRFLPASLAGNPITTGIGVLVTFPPPEPEATPDPG